MNKILITGGAGFIGTALALKLIEQGKKIVILDNLSTQIHGEDAENSFLYSKIKGKVDFFKGDVALDADWDKLPKDIDAIIHLAAETGTGQSMYQIKRYSDVNINGTSIALERAKSYFENIKKFVVASSRAIYGEGKYVESNNQPVYPIQRNESDLNQGIFDPTLNGEILKMVSTDEDSLKNPVSVYGITKLSQEQLTLNVCNAFGIPAVALRFQNVYGPGQSLENPYTGILSIFSKQLLNQKPINIFEDGLESRDFVYIDDVVESIILSLKNDSANGKSYNVGTGVATTVSEVAELLKKYYNSTSEISVSGNYRVGDIRHNKADISAIQNDLGFSPKFDFATGLKNFTDWVLTQKVEGLNYEDSLKELKEKGLLK